MYDADALESINIDQLATPLDRLLLRRGTPHRTRRSFDLTREAELAVAASKRRVDAERTMHVRSRSVRARVDAAVSTLAVGAAVTWLSVAVVCLLA